MSLNKQRHAEKSVNYEDRLPQPHVVSKYKLQVIRDVCDSDGQRLDVLHAPYDGSVEDAVRVAENLTDLMYRCHEYASNIQSRILATDEYGRGKWAISPNFKHIAEAGTAEAAYIGGDLRFAPTVNAS